MENPSSGLVSIVTPVLNGGLFIEATIRSIMAQSYGKIEHIIVDGGSTDSTLEIIKRYHDNLQLIVAPQLNQAAAVNAGFARSTGEFFGFLNADDIYLPAAIESAVRGLEANPSAAMVYAEADHIDQAGNVLGRYPVGAADVTALSRECVICQPATLLRSSVFESVGGLDESLDYAMDYDLWLRLSARGSSLLRMNEIWAQSRMHAANKTLAKRNNVYREVFEVLRRHFGYVPFNWIHSYAGYILDGRDHFFEPPKGSPLRTIVTLLIGLQQNWRRPASFLGEYYSEIVRLRRAAA